MTSIFQLWLIFLLTAWAMWCIGNLALVWFVHRYVPADVPRCTGFGISIPQQYIEILTFNEYTAICAHERGHAHRLHAWENFARLCLFFPATRQRRALQELEADDHAATHGYALPLAAALRKLSRHPTDLARARRLELRYELALMLAKDQQ